MDSGKQTVADACTCRLFHVAAIPHPGRGHINPMMNLCRLLADRDNLTITVIVTEEWLNLICSGKPRPCLPPNIQLRSIPNILPSERTRGDNYAEFFHAVLTKMKKPVECIFNKLEPPADVVIGDALLPWVVDLSKQRNLPAVALWTESASVLLALHTFDSLVAAGQLPADFSGDKELAYLPDVSRIRLSNFLPNATELELLLGFARKYYWFRAGHCLLVTSLDELEPSLIDRIRSEFAVPIYQVGPLIPHMVPPACHTPDYIAWLDSQPKCSVLYVSLGSFLPISASHMEGIAGGLMDSGIPFLWVVRGQELHSIEKTNKEGSAGMIVPWCDQLRVLCHPSVGAFLTHCGWNSTLEAVYAGVPMITFPLFWDQEPNSKLVVEEWRIGFRLQEKQENLSAELVARKVRKMMDADDGDSKRVRDRAGNMKGICREALKPGGCVSHYLDCFVQQMKFECDSTW